MSRTKEYTSKTNEPTSKTKESLNIPETDIIIWTPFNLPPEDNQKMKLYTRSQTYDKTTNTQMKTELFLRDILKKWFYDNYETITKETEELLSNTIQTEEDLEKELSRIQRLTERLTMTLQKKKTLKEIETINTEIQTLSDLLANMTDEKEIKDNLKKTKELKTRLETLTKIS